MQVPERVYMVFETKLDGKQYADSFEFTTQQDAQERMYYLMKNGNAGSSYTIESVTWLHEI